MLVSLGCYRFDEYAEGIMVVMMLFGAQISVASRVREATKQTDQRAPVNPIRDQK